MTATVSDARLDVHLRNAKATLPAVQKLTNAGAVLNRARAGADLEPKVMAGELGISHSLCLRALKSGEVSWRRLWELPDAFWAELLIAVAQERSIGAVRTTLDIQRSA